VVEQLDAHRLAEYAEALGEEVDERVGEGVGDGGRVVHAADRTPFHNCGVDKLAGCQLWWAQLYGCEVEGFPEDLHPVPALERQRALGPRPMPG
jgi:hypothetical protein